MIKGTYICDINKLILSKIRKKMKITKTPEGIKRHLGDTWGKEGVLNVFPASGFFAFEDCIKNAHG